MLQGKFQRMESTFKHYKIKIIISKITLDIFRAGYKNWLVNQVSLVLIMSKIKMYNRKIKKGKKDNNQKEIYKQDLWNLPKQ